MYQNVADDAISAGESANFIISQMKAFGLEAEDATHIIDALNEVSNTQAVSSADLANNLGKASAAMALGNNTYEQALSLMTAITEINRSGAKSARALVSVQSRLTQVLDEQSSTGKALVAIYNNLGIALKDQNGQLRPTFEIFKDLAEKWPTLTTNQRDYIALTQAGANQTSNFVALMDNFEAALKAEATAMKSSGSAARENAAYMESLEAQTTQLKATFQDFANNVIDKELVSSVLTLANDALGLLNTETGKTITQWGLLTGVLTGGLTIFGQIGAKLFNAGKGILQLSKHLGILGSAFTGANITATAFAASAAPVAAVIAAIAVAVGLAVKHYKDISQPLSEYTSQIESNNEQLEKNRDRLAEIEQMSWDKKTPEILDEYDALVKQNEELERNIELLEDRKNKQATSQARAGGLVPTGESYYTVYGGGDESTRYKSAEDAALSMAYALGIQASSAKEAKEKIEELGYVIQENTDMVEANYLEYDQHLIKSLEAYQQKIENGKDLTIEEIRDYQNLKNEAAERVEGLKELISQGETLYYTENKLIDVYDSLAIAESVAKNEMVALNQEGVSALLAKYPQLKSAIEDVNGVSYLNVTALGKVENATVEDKIAMYDLIAAQTVFNNSSLDVSQKLKALEQLAIAAGVTSELIANTGSGSARYNQSLRRLTNAGMTMEEAKAQYASSVWKKWIGSIDFSSDAGNNDNDNDNDNDTDKTPRAKIKQATDAALKQFKSLQKDLDHQKEMGLIKEEEYYDKLEELVKQYKAQATDHMKEYGLTVNQINQNMYQYEEEIYKGRKKLADDLAEQQKKAAEEAAQAQKQAAEEAAQAQKEALEKQKEDFETAVNYVIKQIDEEIDKLQDLRDQTEQYYDDKIDAVNKANDALEDQIQHEELLNNLAKAKDKQLYVFQNGQFQYVQDVEAIASAQAELDAYERDKALQKEVENLETLKEQALASIDEQIEGWEKYKEEWESVTTQYQEQQDKLLAEQVLGIDTEQENWNTRLANLQSFVDQYNSILSGLGDIDSGISSGTSNGTTISDSGDGWHLDYSKGTTQYASAMDDPSVTDEWKQANSKSSSSAVKAASGVVIGAISKNITTKKHAIGTLSAPGGLSLVGERGPELRVLNSGDGVIPADATRNLWDWASYNPKDFMNGMGSDNIFHIGNIALPNVTDAKSFVNGLKQLAYQRAYKRA